MRLIIFKHIELFTIKVSSLFITQLFTLLKTILTYRLVAIAIVLYKLILCPLIKELIKHLFTKLLI